MDRTELDFALTSKGYLKGGTKEACIKAKDFLRFATSSDHQISSRSCISSDEFIKAVKTLIAYSFYQEDEVPKMWSCDNSCKRITELICQGEGGIQRDSLKACPYYIEEG